MRPLSRTGAGTLYHQVLLELTGIIESGEVGVGDRLPSEADLVPDFGVSQTTARRALDELRRQGLVCREPGRGTFLVSPRLRSNLAYLHSFSEEIQRWGYTPGARLVSQEERDADEEVAVRLGVEVGEKDYGRSFCAGRLFDGPTRKGVLVQTDDSRAGVTIGARPVICAGGILCARPLPGF